MPVSTTAGALPPLGGLAGERRPRHRGAGPPSELGDAHHALQPRAAAPPRRGTPSSALPRARPRCPMALGSGPRFGSAHLHALSLRAPRPGERACVSGTLNHSCPEAEPSPPVASWQPAADSFCWQLTANSAGPSVSGHKLVGPLPDEDRDNRRPHPADYQRLHRGGRMAEAGLTAPS